MGDQEEEKGEKVMCVGESESKQPRPIWRGRGGNSPRSEGEKSTRTGRERKRRKERNKSNRDRNIERKKEKRKKEKGEKEIFGKKKKSIGKK